jgi:hypothetical protein
MGHLPAVREEQDAGRKTISLSAPILREIHRRSYKVHPEFICRHYLIPGALVALLVIEASALIGVALAAGEPGLMLEGAQRFGLDVLLIVAGGVPIVLLKQALVHRRAPMV